MKPAGHGLRFLALLLWSLAPSPLAALREPMENDRRLPGNAAWSGLASHPDTAERFRRCAPVRCRAS